MSEGMIIRRGGVGGSVITPYVVTVTCDSAFAGQTISMSQTGQQTVSATCPSSSPYTVELHPMYSGTWTISGYNGSITRTTTVALSNWGSYSVTLLSFSATIRISTTVNGSTVSVSKGSTTISSVASETSGSLYYSDIEVNEIGTWNITDDQSNLFGTYTVDVTGNETYSITLKHGIYLYNEGDECTSVTGGWIGEGITLTGYNSVAPWVSKKASYMICALTSEGNYAIGRVKTTNTIDVTNYNYLCLFSNKGNVQVGGSISLGTTEEASIRGYNKYSYVANGVSNYTNKTTVVNINSETGMKDVGMCFVRKGSSGNPAQAYAEVNKIWLIDLYY